MRSQQPSQQKPQQRPLWEIDAQRRRQQQEQAALARGETIPSGTLFRTCPGCNQSFLLSPFLAWQWPNCNPDQQQQICHDPVSFLRNYWADVDARFAASQEE